MNANLMEIGAAYLNALDQKDIPKITSLVDPDIHFKMPVAEVFNRDDFLKAVRRMLANSGGVHIVTKFASGNQAVFIYEVNFNEPIGPMKTASLMTFAGDKIKEIEVFFDARPFGMLYGSRPELKKAA
jgi:hypothetical protein